MTYEIGDGNDMNTPFDGVGLRTARGRHRGARVTYRRPNLGVWLIVFLTVLGGVGRAQTTLTNGAYSDGTIIVNEADTWTFTANKGDNIELTCVRLTGSFNPWMRLYGMNSVFLTDAESGTETRIFYQATNSGTFTVLVRSYFAGGSGSYRLRLTQLPGAYVTIPPDESGALTNGGYQDGAIPMGDQDFWTFTANAGDNIELTCVRLTGSFNPWMRLYGMNSVFLTDAESGTETRILYQPTNSGTFTVLVGSYFEGGSGTYRLRLTQLPGAYVTIPPDESGALTNGGYQDGAIDVGDQDFWTFTANAGDNIELTCVLRSGSFNPWMRLYGMNSVFLTGEESGSETRIFYQPTNSGTFTVLVGSYFEGGSGTYRLRLTQVPGSFVVLAGDEGGTLTNGFSHDGTVQVGDVDIWTFSACKGSHLALNCLKLTGSFNPWIRVYSAKGVFLAQASSSTEADVSGDVTSSETFTALVGSYYAGSSGTYRLTANGIFGPVMLNSPIFSGSNLTVSGSGRGTNCTCVMLTATNIADPVALWIPVATNSFGTDGQFLFTLPFDRNSAQQFYRLNIP